MESPAAAHSASPAELQAAPRGRARAGCRSCSGATPAGQRILALERRRAPVTVGRGAEVDVALDADEQVSRLHAEIERIGGEWTVSDDGLSRNGSFLNGERVGGRRRLADGDELRFGDDDRRLPRAGAARRARRRSPPPTRVAGRRADRDPAQDPRSRSAGRFARAAATRRPATNQQIADEVFLSRRRGQGPPAGAVREVRDRRPAAEPEAGAAGRAGAAKRRDLGPRPRMSADAGGRPARRSAPSSPATGSRR